MGISNFTLSRIFNELKQFVLGAKIDRIINISETSFLLNLFKDNQCRSLLLSLDPTLPICLMSKSYHVDAINPPSYACSILKKYFERGIINNFEKVDDDRIFIFTISKWSPSYQKIEAKLIFELFPLSPNIIVTDLNYIILDAFKKTESFDSKHPIQKNIKYLFPVSLPKTFDINTPCQDLKGKINKSELIYLQSLSNEDYKIKMQGMFNETKYYLVKNDVTSIKINESINPLTMEELFLEIINKKTFENKEAKFEKIFKLVNQKIKSLKKKIINLNNDKSRFNNCENYLEKGNLLFLGSDNYKRGDKSIVIENNIIELDPKLDLNQNAQKYFKLYKKSKTGIIQVEIQKQNAIKELDYFERIQNQMDHASLEDMKEIILDLSENHYIKLPKEKTKNKKPGNKRYTPHFIKAPDGTKIGYGLSSFQNEELTFNCADKNHIYLHIKDYHGPHVIIFDENPSEDSLRFAGEIALYYASKEAGEIYYTKRKNVKKVPGIRGLVTMTNHTIMVLNSIREETIKSILSR